MNRKRSALALAPLAALALTAPLLAGCSTGAAEDASSGSPAPGAVQTDGASSIALAEGWAKAGDTGGMTGVFGSLENHGDEDRVIVSVESEAAGSAELHEVTSSGVMQEIPGEVVVPAGGSIEFSPGADHIMLMDLVHELLAGDEVPITVAFDDGSEASFSVLVKDYAGANENYGDQDPGEHGADEHGAGEHADHGGH